MTRSCYHPTRGYCFCEFCIASHMKNAYVQANNSPQQPIDFKNFKKTIQLSPLEIYCRQFNNGSPTERATNSQPRAYTKTPLNSPNLQTNKKINLVVDDNQTKFLRILSDRLTQLAEQQAQYIISTSGHGNSPEESALNLSLLQRRAKFLGNLKLTIRPARLRSSISESSGYETSEQINESPLPNLTHCNSAGMLFNTAGLSSESSNTQQKIPIKFGPEDILATTNPMLLFSSHLVDESALVKRSSRRRRKSGNKKELSLTVPSDDQKTQVKEGKVLEDENLKENKAHRTAGNALSNVTNTIKDTPSS